MTDTSFLNQQHALKRIQWFTIAWMCGEVAVALFTGIRAHSLALAAFGADSAIELSSACIVLWRFWTDRQQAETVATKWTAWLLVALGAYIVADSAYMLAISHLKPESSYLGIAVLAAAALVMPWLGRRKRQLAWQARPGIASRRCREFYLWLSCLDCFGGGTPEHLHAFVVGRFRCRIVSLALCGQGSKRSI